MPRGRRGILAGIVLILSATIGPTASALAASSPIAAGYDLFQTDPGSSTFIFHDGATALPAGFFDPGSKPFTGEIPLCGQPLGSFMGHDTGDADTVVQRKSDATPPTTVPIELVALNLRSCQPIKVTYGNGSTELWDIRTDVSPTQPSTGQLNIAAPITSDDGTFTSQLVILPTLTFTRLSDGQTRSFDTGALAPTIRNGFNTTSPSAPWHPGCAQPALNVPGLNDGFCPGFTGGGVKVQILRQSSFFKQGMYVVQPRLEHFRCYSVGNKPFEARNVALTDQFGRRSASISRRAELCNPAQKNTEPFVNRKAHLQCYVTSGEAVGRNVTIQNQFGSQRLAVGQPIRLCLPTRKRLLSQSTLPPIAVPIDAYQCYAVKALSPIRSTSPVGSVAVVDEFVSDTTKVGVPVMLCVPAQRGSTPIKHRVTHLMCYRTDAKAISPKVEIKNAFEQKFLQATGSLFLCVPSNKVVLSP